MSGLSIIRHMLWRRPADGSIAGHVAIGDGMSAKMHR
jgi:hypothetical protein